MRKHALAVALALGASVSVAGAVGPTVNFTLPPLHETPSVFGSLPFPCDLYFDQGSPAGGDGTLINADAPIGLDAQVVTVNTASVQDGLDLLDGFGTTSATYFFFSGPIDAASLPPSPRLTPALTDAVFCADAVTATPVPVEIKFGVDTRIPNVLAIVPAAGRPLQPKTTYTCVVRTGVTGGGDPVVPSTDFVTVLNGTSTNTDADSIYGPVLTVLAAHGVAAADIAGMTVFTTESTTHDLIRIRDVVLPGLAVPSADFTSQPNLVFDTAAKLTALLGSTPHSHVAKIATGFYGSARFQTHDPKGDGPLEDLPLPPSFINCSPAAPCETADEHFTRDGNGNPIVIDIAQIPFTVVIPSGTPPPGGWPIMIQQHGLGGQRDTVVGFGDNDAAAGFASIGIDAAKHGYRFFNCGPSASCPNDLHNNFGGTAAPDGFIDTGIAGFSPSFLSVNLGFFQAFHNFIAIRDNFRQTYADLLSLVRLIKGHSIDGPLGAPINDAEIFYVGHSLGGLMGSGFVPISPDIKAALLNASGGGLNSRLFVNSSIGAGAFSLIEGILGLDPSNAFDEFAFLPNLAQTILDPADGVNSAALLLTPGPGGGAPRNVIQVEDFGDEVVPNESNEALAIASGLPIFDPYVENLHQTPVVLPIANPGTPGTVHGNAAAGAATAVLLQNGPATHAASIATFPGRVTFVPEFAHWEDEFSATGNAFPPLLRDINVPNAGIFPSVLAWFNDIVAHGTPGTFTFTAAPNFNPIQNAEVPTGATTVPFFARTVDVGGATPTAEPTPDVTVAFTSNVVASRVTAGRSILGTTVEAADTDLPPGQAISPLVPLGPSLPTLGVLPFFVTLQRELAGLSSGNVTIAYTPAELAIAGIPPGSADEAKLVVAAFDGTTYTPLPSSVDTVGRTVTATGVTTFDETFVVAHQDVFGPGFLPPLVAGRGGTRNTCRGEFEVVDATNSPFLDAHGRVNMLQVCHDGDATCDADRTKNGTCVFRLAVCFHVTDPLCPPADVTAFELVRPSVLSRNAIDAANAQAILSTVKTFGTLAGKQVTFNPAITALRCSAAIGFQIGTAEGTGQVRMRTLAGSGAVNLDRLKLRCLP